MNKGVGKLPTQVISSAANWERRLIERDKSLVQIPSPHVVVFSFLEKGNYCVDLTLTSCSGLLTWQLFYTSVCLFYFNGVIRPEAIIKYAGCLETQPPASLGGGEWDAKRRLMQG